MFFSNLRKKNQNNIFYFLLRGTTKCDTNCFWTDLLINRETLKVNWQSITLLRGRKRSLMGQENIISIDLQSNLGLIDPVIRGIEEINEKMNGAAPLIWDQACHTKLLAVHRLYSSLI